MSERTSTIRSRELGHQLRFYREDAGLTQQFAAKRIGLSTASMCRIEDGSKPPTSEQVCALLALYNVTGPEREALMTIAREVNMRGWWRRRDPKLEQSYNVPSLESRTCTITSHERDMVPGLLQIPEYVEAAMRLPGVIPEERIARLKKERLARRHILFRDDPVHLVAFIGETALQRAYGSTAVMHRQLQYLLKMMERANVIIRVVPNTGVNIRSIENFLLLRFPVAPAIVHVETATSDLFFEEPEEITHYDDAVHALMRAALDTGESAGLITRLMHMLEEDPDVLPRLAWPPVEEE